MQQQHELALLREQLAHWEKQEAEHSLTALVAKSTADALRQTIKQLENGHQTTTQAPDTVTVTPDTVTVTPDNLTLGNPTRLHDGLPVQPRTTGVAATRGRARHASPGEMHEAVLRALTTLGKRTSSRWVTTGQVAKYVSTHRPPSLRRRRIDMASWRSRVLHALEDLVRAGKVEQNTSSVLRRKSGRAEYSWRVKP